MRRRKNAKTRMRDGLLEAFNKSIVDKLQNRHMLLCPFPLDPMTLYRSLWTDAQYVAVQVLDNIESLFYRRSHMHLRIPLFPEKAGTEVHIRVSVGEKPLPMGGGNADEIDYTKLTDEEQEMVRSWIVDWRKFKDDTDAVETALSDVVLACNSIGQVIRIWPDLLGFMASHQQDAIKDKAACSPYPRDALECYQDAEGKLRHRLSTKFHPDRFTALHDVIAEALMLPEYENLTHVATHEWSPPA